MENEINSISLKTQDQNLLDFFRNQGQIFVVIPKPEMINGELIFVKWKKNRANYIYEKYIPGCVLRSMFNNEIFIEFDNAPEMISIIEDKLKNLGIQFAKFDHGGRSPWLHIYNVQCMESLTPEENVNYRKEFYRMLGVFADVDAVKAPQDCLVPIEYALHWKHNVLHDIVSGTDPLEQKNCVIPELIEKIKVKQEVDEAPNIPLLDWKEDQIIGYAINGKVTTGQKKNNKLFKFVAIRLKDLAVSQEDLEDIAGQICSNCKGHSKSEILDWFTIVKENNYVWNSKEVNDYIIEQNLPLKHYPISSVKIEGNEDKKSVSKKILDLILNSDVELFTDATGQSYCQIEIDGHFEEHSVKSSRFRNWISKLYWDLEEKVVYTQTIKNVIPILEAKAFEGEQYPLYNRYAIDFEGNIYVDLCDSEWRVIKITKDGWNYLECRPILFKRYSHQKQLVVKQPNKNAEETLNQIFNFISISNEEDKFLLKIDLITKVIESIPKTIINFYGDPGAGKSFAFRIIRKILDPSSIELLTLHSDKVEIVQQLDHHYCNFYDNLGDIHSWISDIFCKAVTGDGFSKRELYSNDDDVIRNYRRCIGLGGINVVAQKPDLLDRSILIKLQRIKKTKRKTEKKLFEEFNNIQPEITGAIFDIMSGAIQLYPTIKIESLPRMADYAIWGEAISRSLGYPEGKFLNLYYNNLQNQNNEAIEAHILGLVLLRFVEDNCSDNEEFLPSELLGKLKEKAIELRVNTKDRAFPKAPNTLTRKINEIKTNFLEKGIEITLGVHTSKGNKIIIKKVVEIPSLCSLPSEWSKDEIDKVLVDKCCEDTSEDNIHNNLHNQILDYTKKRANEDCESNEGLFFTKIDVSEKFCFRCRATKLCQWSGSDAHWYCNDCKELLEAEND